MERFWTLKFVQDHESKEYNASVIKNMPGQPVLARLDELPLVFELHPPRPLQRGEPIRVALHHIDLISLSVEAQFLQSLQVESLDKGLESLEEDLFEMDESEMEGSNALGALTLEMDLGEDEPSVEHITSVTMDPSPELKGEPLADA
jgi:exoribonuclease-2